MKPIAHPAFKDVESTNIFYALGDKARLCIVRNLYQSKSPLTCSQAVEGIDGLAISTRSNCFRVLRESGLIHSEKHGRECYNSLRLEELNEKFPGLIQAIIASSA